MVFILLFSDYLLSCLADVAHHFPSILYLPSPLARSISSTSLLFWFFWLGEFLCSHFTCQTIFYSSLETVGLNQDYPPLQSPLEYQSFLKGFHRARSYVRFDALVVLILYSGQGCFDQTYTASYKLSVGDLVCFRKKYIKFHNSCHWKSICLSGLSDRPYKY